MSSCTFNKTISHQAKLFLGEEGRSRASLFIFEAPCKIVCGYNTRAGRRFRVDSHVSFTSSSEAMYKTPRFTALIYLKLQEDREARIPRCHMLQLQPKPVSLMPLFPAKVHSNPRCTSNHAKHPGVIFIPRNPPSAGEAKTRNLSPDFPDVSISKTPSC